MIARVWRATATQEGADRYVDYFNRSVRLHVMTIAGFRDARVLRRDDGDVVEILVITEWDNEASVRAFSGADIDAAVVEPEAVSLLRDAENRVRNFHIVA